MYKAAIDGERRSLPEVLHQIRKLGMGGDAGWMEAWIGLVRPSLLAHDPFRGLRSAGGSSKPKKTGK